MALRRYMGALGPALLLTVGGAYALASIDWCDWPAGEPPRVQSVGRAAAQLEVGAAKVELSPPYPVVVAGYPPPRPEARKAAHPLYARATVLSMGDVRVAVVSVELLTLPGSVVEKVRARVAPLELSDVWLSATHAHSSFGGYDPRLVSELAGTGRHREAAELAVVSATAAAIEQAAAALRPAVMGLGTADGQPLVQPRSAGAPPSGELLRVQFRELAEGGKPLAEWILWAAHPTNVGRGTEELDGDFPGFLSRALEEKHGAPALFLQRAVGNAGPGVADGGGSARAAALAQRLLEAVEALPLQPADAGSLQFARLEVSLPPPDATRLVPGLFARPGANFLCGSAPRTAHASALVLGPLRLFSVPGELTQGAADVLEPLARAKAVSLVNGYVGYVETQALVEQKAGEARRQYFHKALLDHWKAAAEGVGQLFP